MDSPRWLVLDGAANARDLGGLPVVTGGSIRPGRLLRSDSPAGLSDPDVRYLVDDLGVSTVVDLRTGVELRGEGPGPLAADPGVGVHHLSLLPEPAAAPTAVADPTHEPDPTAGPGPDRAAADRPREMLPWQDPTSERARQSARLTYLRYLAERPDSVLAALQLLAHAEGATLVHCAAGKDRTGVIVAMALSAVGVRRDAIVADYVASADRIEAIMARLAASPTYAGDPAITDLNRHRPRARTMEGFLDGLDTEHGGALSWLRRTGWTAADDTALRRSLLES